MPTPDREAGCGHGAAAGTGTGRRLAAAAGRTGQSRVVLLDSAPDIGGSLGAGPRDAIQSALSDLRIETRCGVALREVTPGGVVLGSGETIPALTVVATTG